MTYQKLLFSCLLAISTSLGFAQTTIPGGTYSNDQHWDLAGSPYTVTGTVRIFGSINPRLTIEPGVEVRFTSGARLEIAYALNTVNSNHRGELYAVGTSSDPILFTADNGSSGGWAGIHFFNSSDYIASSSLQFCQIEKATVNLTLNRTTAPAPLLNVALLDASAEGLRISQSPVPPVLSDITISGSATYPVVLSGSGLPDFFNMTLSGNGESRLGYTGTIIEAVSLDLAAYGADLLFFGSTKVIGNDASLTLAPGSELRFANGADMQIAHSVNTEGNTYRGELHAIGTPVDPIIFTADNDTPGGWAGLKFYNSSDYSASESDLEYCRIEKASTNLHLYRTAQPSTLGHLELLDAENNGLLISQTVSPSEIIDVTISGSGSYPVALSGSGLPYYSGLTLSGNAFSRFSYSGTIIEDLTLDIASYPMDLVISSSILIRGSANPRLTLTPGSELRFLSGTSLQIGHSVNAEGSSYRGQLDINASLANPVVLTADNDVAGGWSGVHFYNASDYSGALSTLVGCRIEKAQNNLTLYRTTEPSTFSDVELLDASESGLVFSQCPQPPTPTNTTISSCASFPVELLGSSLPDFVNPTFSSNGSERFSYSGTIIHAITLDPSTYFRDLLFVGTTKIVGVGSKLTLQPGSILDFDGGAALEIAHSVNTDHPNYAGQLEATGTELDPIHFRADDGTPGGWSGIRFYNSSDNGISESTMEHSFIEHAINGLTLNRTTQPVLLQNLEIANCSSNGLTLSQSPNPAVIDELSIHDCGGYGLALSGASLPTITSSDFIDNLDDRIGYSGTIIEPISLDLATYPHDLVFYGTTKVVGSTATLTLTAGSHLDFAANAALEIGHSVNTEHSNYKGELRASGDSSNPIIFTGDTSAPGFWQGIRFYNSSDYNGAISEMNHCVVSYAEKGLDIRRTNQPPLDNVDLLHCSIHGLSLDDSYPTVHSCSFVDNATGLYLNNALETTIGDTPLWSCLFDLSADWELYNNGTGDVMARNNHWCPPEGQTMSHLIFDQLDDPSKGLVTYLPTIPGTTMRMTAEYRPDQGVVHFEWCPYAGAIEYLLYRSDVGYWDISADTPIATVIGSSYDLPIAPGVVDLGFFKIVAVLP